MASPRPRACGPGDARRGALLFRAKCAYCHALEAAAPRRSGPALAAMFDGRPGSAPGYAFSRALATAPLARWDDDSLAAFLERPAALVPGTKMVFGGVKSAEDRRDLVACVGRPPALRMALRMARYARRLADAAAGF